MPRILVIEESQKLSELLAKFLNKKGFDSDIAHDGGAAVRLLTQNTYALLLVSRELPMMTGDVFCKKLRETPRGRDIPIIMMSGYLKEQADIALLTRDLRLQGFLIKPFTSDILFSLVTSALGTASASPAREQGQPERQQRTQKVKGSLDKVPFEQILLYLFRKKATGTLTVSREGVSRVYFLVAGAVADLDIAPDDKDFGDYLAEKKLAEPAEVREYKERRRDGGDSRDLFVKMGCITPEQFQGENAAFLQERLIETFTWKTGSAFFEPAAGSLSIFPSTAVFMPGVFFRAFHGEAFAGAIRVFLAERGKTFPVRTADFFEYQNHLAAEGALAEALDLCDGRKSCSEILGSIDAEEAGVLFYTLHYLKALTFSETPPAEAVAPPFPLREHAQKQKPGEAEKFEDLRGELSDLADEVGSFEPARIAQAEPAQNPELSTLEADLKQHWESIKDKNYYEMFGLKQNSFSFEKLKNAYFHLTRTYGPEKFFASSSDVMSLAEEMLSKVSNAYETLSNVVSKENYDELLASQVQVPEGVDDKQFYEQIQFQSGKVFVEQGQYDSAEKAFQNCVTIDPEKAEYLAYLALAVYHNPANRGNPAAVKRAKETVNKSLQLGKLSIAHALKGTIYLDEGGLNFAEAEFNKALRLNPNNKTALKKLELIKTKREDEKKGIFQRMFK